MKRSRVAIRVASLPFWLVHVLGMAFMKLKGTPDFGGFPYCSCFGVGTPQEGDRIAPKKGTNDISIPVQKLIHLLPKRATELRVPLSGLV